MTCLSYHRKHPTPEQYEWEYCEKYEVNRPVWIMLDHKIKDWQVAVYKDALNPSGYYQNGHYSKVIHLVCACTPFGKPDRDWRPQ
jgi:hypothetical protein